MVRTLIFLFILLVNIHLELNASPNINFTTSINESDLKFRELDSNFIFIGYKNRKRYYLSKDRFTWNESDLFTRQYPNLRLAIIKDSATNKFIADSALKYFPKVNGNTNENIAHIGAKYFTKYKSFRNIDMSPLNFSKWRGGHPQASIKDENIQLGLMMFMGSNSNDIKAEWLEAGDLSGWWFIAEQSAYNDDPDTIIYDVNSMFVANNVSNCDSLPARVEFKNYSVNGTSYSWNFGDGSLPINDVNPTYTYTQQGRFKISLIANNSFSIDTSFYEIVIGGCPIEYISFQNNKELLYPWKGKNIIMLSQKNNLDTLIMSKWIKSLDRSYDYFKFVTGKDPKTFSNNYIFNLRTIAQVNSTCGAGCGYLGASGIEYLRSFFDVDYHRIKIGRGINHIPFYEFGRNFWFYDEKLEYKENSGSIATGFAVFMRYKSMENQSEKFTFEAISIDSMKNETKSLYKNLINDTSYSWKKSVYDKGGFKGKFYNYGSSDIIASILFYLSDNYGDSIYLKKLFSIVDTLPNARNTQSAIDNFIYASSSAANSNLICFFEAMKFPISDSLRIRLSIFKYTVDIPQVAPDSICLGKTALPLKVTASLGHTLRWYGTNASGGIASGTAPVPLTNSIGVTNYFVSQVNNAGCESNRARIVYTVNALPAKPIISWNGTELSIPASYSGYKWILNNLLIPNATSSVFKPINTGQYKVVVSNSSGCSDTSSVYNLVVTSASSNISEQNIVNVFPNPANDFIVVDLGFIPTKPVFIQLFDNGGRLLTNWTQSQRKKQYDLSQYSSGSYLIQINNGKTKTTKLVLK